MALNGIMLTNVGVQGSSAIRNEAQKKVFAGLGGRMAEMFLKVVTGKEIREWWEAGRRGIPVPVSSKHCRSKRQMGGPPSVLP